MEDSLSAQTKRFRDTLLRVKRGEPGGLEAITEQVYGELKRIAAAQLRREKHAWTLQPTALVHEAYLSLAGGSLDADSRAHFLAIAARAMRQVLVHHARARNAEKRGGGGQRVTLHEDLAGAAELASGAAAADVQALHDALEELERIDARKGRIVELRFFGGLTEAETAQAMELSVPTVAREMRVARALLLHLLRGKGDATAGP